MMTDSAAERIARLTPRQRECLSLTREFRSSKAIARELGISHHTARQHISAAMQVLGVSTRDEGARLLALHRGEVTPAADASTLRNIDFFYRPSDPDGDAEARLERLADVEMPYRIETLPRVRRSWTRLPPILGDVHDLTPAQRLTAILMIAVLPYIILLAPTLIAIGIADVGWRIAGGRY